MRKRTVLKDNIGLALNFFDENFPFQAFPLACSQIFVLFTYFSLAVEVYKQHIKSMHYLSTEIRLVRSATPMHNGAVNFAEFGWT